MAAASLTALLVAGCGDGERADRVVAGDAQPPRALATQLGPQLDGLYVDDSVIITNLANGVVEVDTALPCTSFRQGILGGDASLVGDFDFPKFDLAMFGAAPIAPSGFVVSIDSRPVYIEMSEPPATEGCIARVYPGVYSADALPVEAGAAGPGFWAFTTQCLGGEDSLSALTYLLSADGAGAAVMYELDSSTGNWVGTLSYAVAGKGRGGFIAVYSEIMARVMADDAAMQTDTIPPELTPEGATFTALMPPIDGVVTASSTDPAFTGTVQFGPLAFSVGCPSMIGSAAG